MSEETDHNFKPGEKFRSFEEFSQKLEQFQKTQHVQLYKRSSTKIEKSKKEIENSDLVYCKLKYTCIHGGRNFCSKSEGARPNQSTFQMSCPMVIILNCVDGRTLEVTKYVNEHNHDTSEVSYQHLFHQRKLEKPLKEEVEKLLKMKSNKKLVQDHIREQTGQIVTLKDLHNINTKARDNNTDLQALLKRMKEVKGATIDILSDETGLLKGIFFQDETMATMFQKFPEVLLIDATYKLNELRLPLFVLMSVDGNGESEVVSLWIVSDESRDTIRDMIRIFKRVNENWSNIKCVMSDKDMVERDVIRDEIPGVPLLICLFHVLRTFKREVTTEKLGLTKDERIMALEILQKLAYAKSQEKYDELYKELKDTHLESVVRYYDKNWHNIKDEWVEGLKSNANHLMNSTNNRVESLNQKLKAVITKFSNIVAFFDDLMKTIRSLRTERDHRAIKMFQKVKVNRFDSDENLSQYSRYVTPYAFRYIAQQMELSSKLNNETPIIPETVAVSISGSEGHLTVTENSCQCSFFKCMSLPCKHIFYFRRKANRPIFDEKLVAYRWSRSYYKKSHVAFSDKVEVSENEITLTTTPRRRRVRVLSGQDKYRRIFSVTTELARLVFELPHRSFNEHVHKIEQINAIMKAGKNYTVEQVDIDQTEEVTSPKLLTESLLTIDGDSIPGALETLPSQPATEDEQGNFRSRDQGESSTLSTIPEALPADDVQNDLDSIASDTTAIAADDTSTSGPMDKENPTADNITCTEDENIASLLDERPSTAGPDETALVPFSNLRLPPKIVRRGRPRGAETTVIGLPKRSKRVMPFLKRSPREKEEAMLSWVIKEDVNIQSLLDGGVVVETNIKDVHTINIKILDENININRIKKYFINSAWLILKKRITDKKEEAEWLCQRCGVDVHLFSAIVCDGCLEWHHLKCLGLKAPPKTTYWMCRKCLKSS